MSRAIAVCHGSFGRASIYDLDCGRLVMHAHREAHLIFHIGRTPSRVIVNGSPVVLGNHSGVAVNPWEPHAFQGPDCNGKITCLVIYLKPEWLAKQAMRPSDSFVFPSATVPLNNTIAAWRDHVVDILLSGGANFSLPAALFTLAQNCREAGADYVESKQCAALTERTQSVGLIDKRVSRARDLLEASPTYEGSMVRVARDAGLSRAHFFKLFRENIGVPPSIFANTIRLDAALDRIARTADSITDISADLGFSCQSVFTRFFASHVGMAPSNYRRAVCSAGVEISV
jgi:AraC-like DNA-binding protein